MVASRRTVVNPVEQFVGRVREAVTGPDPAHDIQRAVSRLISNYQSNTPTRR